METIKAKIEKSEELLDSEKEVVMNNKNFQVSVVVKRRFDDFSGIVDEDGINMREVTVSVMLHNKRLSKLVALFGGLEGSHENKQQ